MATKALHVHILHMIMFIPKPQNLLQILIKLNVFINVSRQFKY